MPFADDIIRPLRDLAGRLTAYSRLRQATEVSELADAFEGGGWPGFSLDQQHSQLNHILGILDSRALGEGPVCEEPEYALVWSLVYAEHSAIRQQLRDRV